MARSSRKWSPHREAIWTPHADGLRPVRCWRMHDGYVTAIDVEKLGLAIIEMGGGRKRLDDAIDHSVGLEMLVRLGDSVQQGQPLLNVFAQADVRQAVQSSLQQAIDDRRRAGFAAAADHRAAGSLGY